MASAYSVDQVKQLIQKGFNPNACLYLENEKGTMNAITDMTEYLGEVFTTSDPDFWYSFEDSKCGPNCAVGCSDKKARFINSAGFRVKKRKNIGKGGFGSVYKGKVHETEIGAKFINITAQYKEIFAYDEPGQILDSDTVIKGLIGEVAYEATAQRKFGHKNILQSKEWWLQFSNRNLIELVISTPKCYLNLKEWVETEKFNFDEVRRFLVETCEALEYLAGQNLAHRDVKPANILISEKLNPTAKLTDFGLMKSDGVTPVFCAPEQFVKNGTVIGKTDVHGLGITTMVTLFESNDAIKILFGVTKSVSPAVLEIARSDPAVVLVTEMINYNPAARPSLLEVRSLLQNLPSVVIR